MTTKIAAILLFPFIFGITILGYADSVKSIDNSANQETIMKMDENKAAMQQKVGVAREFKKPLTKPIAKFKSNIPYSEDGEIIVCSQFHVNFITTLKEKERSPLAKSIDKMINSYGYSQNAWGEKFLMFNGVEGVKSTNLSGSPSHLGPHPLRNNYFEEKRILETFKLLQFKREELSKEIFLGFRFSFNPLSGHMLLELDATPSFEKGSGLIIPF
jgi:hypothetical protein